MISVHSDSEEQVDAISDSEEQVDAISDSEEIVDILSDPKRDPINNTKVAPYTSIEIHGLSQISSKEKSV